MREWCVVSRGASLPATPSLLLKSCGTWCAIGAVECRVPGAVAGAGRESGQALVGERGVH